MGTIKLNLSKSFFLFLLLIGGLSSRSFASGDLDICVSASIDTQTGVGNLAPLRQEIEAKLEVLQGELRKILETDKQNILPEVLAMIGRQDLPSKTSVNQFYSKVLTKTDQALKELKSNVSFTARISILPSQLCEKLRNQTLAQETLQYYLNTEAEQGEAALAGFNLNFQYSAGKSGTGTNLSYKAKVSGGVIVTMPTNYKYPMNVTLDVSKAVPNMLLDSLFFEKDSSIPEQKHYVLFSINNVNLSDEGFDFVNIKNSDGTHPQFDLYFTDNIILKRELTAPGLILEADLSRPLRGLLADFMLEKCKHTMEATSDSYLSKICDSIGHINLAINHLVLEMEPYQVTTGAVQALEKVVFIPKLRAPIHRQNELGGVKFMVRRFAPFAEDRNQRPEHPWFSFYLNSDFLINKAIGIPDLLTMGIDKGYEKVLNDVADRVSFFLEFREALKRSYKQQTSCDNVQQDTNSPLEAARYYYCWNAPKNSPDNITNVPRVPDVEE